MNQLKNIGLFRIKSKKGGRYLTMSKDSAL